MSEGAPGGPGVRPLTLEIVSAAALGVLCLTAFLLVPLVGVLGIPFAGVLAVRLAHRAGAVAGLVSAALAVAALAGLGMVTQGAPAGLAALGAATLALPALAAGATRHGFGSSNAYLALAAAGSVFVLTYAAVQSAAGGRTVEAEMAEAFARMVPTAVESFARSNKDPEAIARFRQTLVTAGELGQRLWAGLAAACWVLACAVAFYTGARAARPAPSAEASRFESLRVPAPWAGLFVLAGGGTALLAGHARDFAGNVLLPLTALFFVAGLSIICHFARRWFRIRILRAGLYALLVYFPMNVGVALLGLFDWYADFRRRGEGAIEKS